MYSYGRSKKQNDLHEHTYSSYVRIRDEDLRIYQRWWTIGKSGERGSGISVLAARRDDDDDDDDIKIKSFLLLTTTFLQLLLIGKVYLSFLAQSAGATEYTNCISADPNLNECPGYNNKESDGEAPVMLEIRKMRSNSSLPLLPGRIWCGVVAADRVLSMAQLILNWILMLNWIAWNRTVLAFKLRTYAKLNSFAR